VRVCKKAPRGEVSARGKARACGKTIVRQRPLTLRPKVVTEQEIRPMMGKRRVMQEALFYGFSLERHVPDDHLNRWR
jgi:hypothetical protein